MSRYTEKELNTLFSQIEKDVNDGYMFFKFPLEKYPGAVIDIYKRLAVSYGSERIQVRILLDGNEIASGWSEAIKGTKEQRKQIMRDRLEKTMSEFEVAYQAFQKGETSQPLFGGGGGDLDVMIKAAKAKQALDAHAKGKGLTQEPSRRHGEFER